MVVERQRVALARWPVVDPNAELLLCRRGFRLGAVTRRLARSTLLHALAMVRQDHQQPLRDASRVHSSMSWHNDVVIVAPHTGFRLAPTSGVV